MYRMLVVLAAVISLVGCGGRWVYDTSNSQALNYANAGKVKGIKDYALTGEELSFLPNRFSTITGTRFRPRQQSTENILFGWVPSALADSREEARDEFSAAAFAAMEDALYSLNINFDPGSRSLYQQLSDGTHYLFSSVFIEEFAMGCPNWAESGEDIDKTCSVESILYMPDGGLSPLPSFVIDSVQGYPFLASDEYDYSIIDVSLPPMARFNSLEILVAVSEHLPQWAYIFVPSSRNSTGEFTMPMLLSQGQIHLFIEPKKETKEAAQ